MIYFGTGINDEFFNALDSGILIAFDELYPEKMDRHVKSVFKEELSRLLHRLRWGKKKEARKKAEKKESKEE